MGVQRDAGNSVFGFVLSVFRRATATGGTARLPRVVGKSIAKELIFTGGKVSGKDAMSIGFVNYCVPAGEAYAKALEIAQEINKKKLRKAGDSLCLRQDAEDVCWKFEEFNIKLTTHINGDTLFFHLESDVMRRLLAISPLEVRW